MRKKLWMIARRNHAEGEVLTNRLKAIRWVLYPLETFYWSMGRSRGYDWQTDTWLIGGVRFSTDFFMALNESIGDTFMVVRENSVLSFMRIDT